MKGTRAIAKRFGDRERERLTKLFRQLGTDNLHEAEAARSRITSLLQPFGKSWTDLVELISNGKLIIDPTIADIAGLGDPDLDQRARVRRDLGELLARHRKNWNDLVDALCSVTSAAWLMSNPSDDPERVNPLELIHHLLQEYVAFREPHEYVAVALWVLHTHIFTHFMVTPRLALRSPVAGCGKTILLDLISKLAAKPAKHGQIRFVRQVLGRPKNGRPGAETGWIDQNIGAVKLRSGGDADGVGLKTATEYV